MQERCIPGCDSDFIEQEADIFILACGAVGRRGCFCSRALRAFRTALQTAVTWWGATRLSTNTALRWACSKIRSMPGPAAAMWLRAATSSTNMMKSGANRRLPHRVRGRWHSIANQLEPPGPASVGTPGEADRSRIFQPQLRHRDGGARYAATRKPRGA